MTTTFGTNVRIIEREPDVTQPASPWPIITPEARAAWHEQQVTLASGYAKGHGQALAWFAEGWERVFGPVPASVIKKVKFSPACLVGHCWECFWPPESCACGHHGPGSCAPPGPVVPEPESSGTARPYITVTTVPAPEQTLAAAATVSAAASPQEAADPGAEDVPEECEGAPDEDPAPTSVIPAADATAVMPATEAETSLIPVTGEDGGQR